MIDEESRAKLHKKLVADKRYTKSYDDFNKQFSNEESRVNLHNKLVEDKKYTKSYDEFNNQFFSDLKKKDKISGATGKVSATVSEGVALETPSITKPEIPPLEKGFTQEVASTTGVAPVIPQPLQTEEQKQIQVEQQEFVDYTSYNRLPPEQKEKINKDRAEKSLTRTEGELAKESRDDKRE